VLAGTHAADGEAAGEVRVLCPDPACAVLIQSIMSAGPRQLEMRVPSRNGFWPVARQAATQSATLSSGDVVAKSESQQPPRHTGKLTRREPSFRYVAMRVVATLRPMTHLTTGATCGCC
jgi:hypothetical protein